MSPAGARWFPTLTDADLGRTRAPPNTLEVEPGRRVAFDLLGPEDGRPCFWFHGSPSGRFEGILLSELARRRGHRFILTDRPGLGRSDPRPGWSMMDVAADAVRLADHLGYERFSVAGGSGGGPFVLALAAHAPGRVRRAVALACAGAFELEEVGHAAGWVDALAARVARAPALLEVGFALGLTPFARLPRPLAWAGGRLLSPSGDPRLPELLSRTLRESLRGGVRGLVEDTRVLHRPWAVPLASIRVPITLVHGTADGFVGMTYGSALTSRIPRAHLLPAPGDGHFETIFDLERLDRLLSDG